MTITWNTSISQLKKRSTYTFSLKTTKNNYLFLYLEGERMGQPSFDAPSEWNAWTCKRKKNQCDSIYGTWDFLHWIIKSKYATV